MTPTVEGKIRSWRQGSWPFRAGPEAAPSELGQRGRPVDLQRRPDDDERVRLSEEGVGAGQRVGVHQLTEADGRGLDQAAAAGATSPTPMSTPVDRGDGGTRAGADVRRVANYVAKYVTKGTEVAGFTRLGPDGTPRGRHAARMASTAVALAPVPELAALTLHVWRRTLGFRGHVSTRSRAYSTTLAVLREERARYQQARDGQHRGEPDGDRHDVDGHQAGAPGVDGAEVVTRASWRLAGHGYSPGQALLAAQVARDAQSSREAAALADERNAPTPHRRSEHGGGDGAEEGADRRDQGQGRRRQ